MNPLYLVALGLVVLGLSLIVYVKMTGERLGFHPTHRHAEGGLYEVLDVELQVHINGEWREAVRYRNAQGMEFVRSIEDFSGRFSPLSWEPN